MAKKRVGILPPAGDTEEFSMDMTPMIDCVFQLLLFFMVVTKMSEASLEALILPFAKFAEPDDFAPNRIVVNITPKGEVKFQGQQYTMKDFNALVSGQVAIVDGSVADAIAKGGSELGVLIRSDASTQYYHLQEAIRVLSKNAVFKIEIAAQKKQ